VTVQKPQKPKRANSRQPTESERAELAAGAKWILEGERIARELRNTKKPDLESIAFFKAMRAFVSNQEPPHPRAAEIQKLTIYAMAYVRSGNADAAVLATIDALSVWFEVRGRGIALEDFRREAGAKGGKARVERNKERDARLRARAAEIRARDSKRSERSIAEEIADGEAISADRVARILRRTRR
jgi:hypothetical protein